METHRVRGSKEPLFHVGIKQLCGSEKNVFGFSAREVATLAPEQEPTAPARNCAARPDA